jgi:hypothetical protein
VLRLRIFKQQVEKQTGDSVQELITDGGGEYTSRDFSKCCETEGLE